MKNKNTGLKVMIVLALILSVAGLSLGFANYASNLKIESETKYNLNIYNQQTWLVSFSTPAYGSAIWYNSTYDIYRDPSDKKITAISEPNTGEMEFFYCTDQYDDDNLEQINWNGNDCSDVEATTVTLNGLTASDIKVSFKNLASAVSYMIPVGNYGLVDAYLKSITFDGTPTCTAANGATISDDALNAICNNIDIIYEFDEVKYSSTTNDISTKNKIESGKQLITGLQIGLKSSDEALFNVAVDKINISIPDITLGFSSVN